MNDQEMKELVGATCPTLNLDGYYEGIMPRVTAQQLGQLLDTAEQGGNTLVWRWLAAQFFRYGQKEVVAAHVDRLVAMVTGSYGAALALVNVPNLADETRDALVAAVKEGYNAAWVLRNAPNLTPANRDALVSLITDRQNAALVLVHAPNLTDENRDTLVALVTDSNRADWVLAKAPNLTAAHRAILANVAG